MTSLLRHSRVLIATSVEAERVAVCDGLADAGGLGSGGWLQSADRITVLAVGVGAVAAAAATARIMAMAEVAGTPFGAVLCAGIAGGFPGRIGVGGLAIGTETAAADLGAEAPDGFIPLSQLELGPNAMPTDQRIRRAMTAALPTAALGPILTVSTATGTAATAAEHLRRCPGAVAEAMEGFGVATAALATETPFAELRAIANLVGPRDRSAWAIPAALGALRTAVAAVASHREES